MKENLLLNITILQESLLTALANNNLIEFQNIVQTNSTFILQNLTEPTMQNLIIVVETKLQLCISSDPYAHNFFFDIYQSNYTFIEYVQQLAIKKSQNAVGLLDSDLFSVLFPLTIVTLLMVLLFLG